MLRSRVLATGTGHGAKFEKACRVSFARLRLLQNLAQALDAMKKCAVLAVGGSMHHARSARMLERGETA
eukprot:15432056-Alexandrium_andersonii.AAC.1